MFPGQSYEDFLHTPTHTIEMEVRIRAALRKKRGNRADPQDPGLATFGG